MVEIKSKEPAIITAGDYVQWKKSLTDYPADQSWVLTYNFRGKGIIDVTATASGADHLVTLTPTQTNPYIPGDYIWQSKVTKASKVHTIGNGLLTVQANLATSSTGVIDGRSHVKRVLDAIEAVIEKRASQEDLSISIDGITTVGKIPWDQLILAHDRYKVFYQAELDALRVTPRGGNPKQVGVRFRRV